MVKDYHDAFQSFMMRAGNNSALQSLINMLNGKAYSVDNLISGFQDLFNEKTPNRY